MNDSPSSQFNKLQEKKHENYGNRIAYNYTQYLAFLWHNYLNNTVMNTGIYNCLIVERIQPKTITNV